jgi:hypothetical protein
MINVSLCRHVDMATRRLRHCERSEAIQGVLANTGLLRCARNDDLIVDHPTCRLIDT